MPLNFPVEDIHLIVQLPALFNACIKLEVVILVDLFPYLVPHLPRIPAEDVLGYALAHPESSVLDIIKACSYSKSTVWNILRHKSTLIGPLYFDGPLTSESYTEILSGPLADLLEDEVSLRDLSRMWYLTGFGTHVMVPPHTNPRNHVHFWRRHLTLE
ncbi:uncharacterized protein TNCV_4497941 [Trichonephila clavipes]|nr:uncharacterized protein TNCV_4497941 [Trichonephila clavipes]